MLLLPKHTPACCSYSFKLLAVPKPHTPPTAQSRAVAGCALCQVVPKSASTLLLASPAECTRSSTRCWAAALTRGSICSRAHKQSISKRCHAFAGPLGDSSWLQRLPHLNTGLVTVRPRAALPLMEGEWLGWRVHIPTPRPHAQQHVLLLPKEQVRQVRAVRHTQQPGGGRKAEASRPEVAGQRMCRPLYQAPAHAATSNREQHGQATRPWVSQ